MARICRCENRTCPSDAITPGYRRSGGATVSLRELVPVQELAGDDHLLDLAGALADQEERGVAVQALDRVLGRVAIPSVDPEGLGDDLVAHLRAEVLGHPGLEVRS